MCNLDPPIDGAERGPAGAGEWKSPLGLGREDLSRFVPACTEWHVVDAILSQCPVRLGTVR